MQVILGSQSPRRKEILGYFSLPFTQATSSFVEEDVPFTGDPKEYVRIIAKGKSAMLKPRFPDAIIITADTDVYHAGKIYNKPKDDADAHRMLSELCGQWHSVFTAVVIRKGDQEFCEVEETRVLFNTLTPEQIRFYAHKFNSVEKAGGFAIENAGALIVRKIEGCFYNVMGLPINTLANLLKKVDIDLWNYIE